MGIARAEALVKETYITKPLCYQRKKNKRLIFIKQVSFKKYIKQT